MKTTDCFQTRLYLDKHKTPRSTNSVPMSASPATPATPATLSPSAIAVFKHWDDVIVRSFKWRPVDDERTFAVHGFTRGYVVVLDPTTGDVVDVRSHWLNMFDADGSTHLYANESTLTVAENGVCTWHDSCGRCHRGHGLPAVIFPNGNCEWYVVARNAVPDVVSNAHSHTHTRARATGGATVKSTATIPTCRRSRMPTARRSGGGTASGGVAATAGTSTRSRRTARRSS